LTRVNARKEPFAGKSASINFLPKIRDLMDSRPIVALDYFYRRRINLLESASKSEVAARWEFRPRSEDRQKFNSFSFRDGKHIHWRT
jgi:hypothetical protein